MSSSSWSSSSKQSSMMCEKMTNEERKEMQTMLEAEIRKLELVRDQWRGTSGVDSKPFQSRELDEMREMLRMLASGHYPPPNVNDNLELKDVSVTLMPTDLYNTPESLHMAQIEILKGVITANDAQLMELQAKIENIEAQNVDLMRTNEEQEYAHRTHLQQFIAAHDSKIVALEAAKEADAQTAACLITQLKAKIEAMESRVIEQEQERARLETRLGALHEAHEKLIATNAEGDAQRSRLQQHIVHMQIASDSLNQTLTDVRTEHASLQSRFDMIEEEANTRVSSILTKYNAEYDERKKLFNQLSELKGNIRVMCRVRPLNSTERSQDGEEVAAFPPETDGTILIQGKKYDFDKVFPPTSGQAGIFQEVRPLIISVLDGYNVCLFAYGQTGSGKTYTMEGTPTNPGIIHSALGDLFSIANERESTGQHKYAISVSMLEIYNENLRDLLSSSSSSSSSSTSSRGGFGGGEKDKESGGIKLEIRQQPGGGGGIMVQGLSSSPVTNLQEIALIMEQGAKNRAVGSTNENEHSSRSHSVVCVHVETSDPNTGLVLSHAKLYLVDLAGSERLSKTGAEGDRLKEAQNTELTLRYESMGSKRD
eukprot:TRINITY_DN3070_c0_g1_i3.p1 TRINITY_DN3070_c0_g1~~TRINITY_DN3070_c0_g1_i3.p1  ORF type:complete len:597 (-),score=144.44 TRINITY_DN3070_c0_g1_i3:514-2304(-)